jgi:hypothetical protein
MKKNRLSAGRHIIQLIVYGKPAFAGTDPLNQLIDKRPGDNIKYFNE